MLLLLVLPPNYHHFHFRQTGTTACGMIGYSFASLRFLWHRCFCCFKGVEWALCCLFWSLSFSYWTDTVLDVEWLKATLLKTRLFEVVSFWVGFALWDGLLLQNSNTIGDKEWSSACAPATFWQRRLLHKAWRLGKSSAVLLQFVNSTTVKSSSVCATSLHVVQC